MAKPTTSGFTISGLLDRSASIRNDYPVERIPVGEIADHPANAAYSMDEAGIAQLAKSIEEEGLTDLPLARKKTRNTPRSPAASSGASPTSSRSCCCTPPTTSCAASP